MKGILTMIWKETKELFSQGGILEYLTHTDLTRSGRRRVSADLLVFLGAAWLPGDTLHPLPVLPTDRGERRRFFCRRT